jgi:hypothetical protein
MIKKISALLLLALSIGASATTLVPIQLLNPTGSTAGQAIVSTGASSAPGWAGVNAVTLNGATFASPPAAGYGSTTPEPVAATTITATSTITPSQTAGVVGTTTNNNANAGSVGEYITATGTGVSLTSGTAANVTSISLTAGDWDVSGSILIVPAGSTSVTESASGINTTSATLPASSLYWIIQSTALTTGGSQGGAVPSQRISLASTTTVFLIGHATFTVSTCTATGTIRARRIR